MYIYLNLLAIFKNLISNVTTIEFLNFSQIVLLLDFKSTFIALISFILFSQDFMFSFMLCSILDSCSLLRDNLVPLLKSTLATLYEVKAPEAFIGG